MPDCERCRALISASPITKENHVQNAIRRWMLDERPVAHCKLSKHLYE